MAAAKPAMIPDPRVMPNFSEGVRLALVSGVMLL